MKTPLENYLSCQTKGCDSFRGERRFWIVTVLLIVVVGFAAYSIRDGKKAQAFPQDLLWGKLYDRGAGKLKIWVAKKSERYYMQVKDGARRLSIIRDNEFGEGESPEFLLVSNLRWLPQVEAVAVANDFARDFDKAVGIILIDERLSLREVSPDLEASSERGPWWFVLDDWKVKDSLVTEIKEDARLWLESRSAF